MSLNQLGRSGSTNALRKSSYGSINKLPSEQVPEVYNRLLDDARYKLLNVEKRLKNRMINYRQNSQDTQVDTNHQKKKKRKRCD